MFRRILAAGWNSIFLVSDDCAVSKWLIITYVSALAKIQFVDVSKRSNTISYYDGISMLSSTSYNSNIMQNTCMIWCVCLGMFDRWDWKDAYITTKYSSLRVAKSKFATEAKLGHREQQAFSWAFDCISRFPSPRNIYRPK